MESYTRKNEDERYERERKRHKILVILTVLLFVAAVVSVVFYIVYRYKNQVYTAYEISKTTKRNDSATAKYIPYKDDAILKYSRDGAVAIDSKGEIIFNGSYDFNYPVADTCGSYVAIADVGGNECFVFSGSDSGTSLKVLYPIVDIRVAAQGVVAILMENGSSNLFEIYNPYAADEKLLLELPTDSVQDGFPVDFDISEDGKKMVTSYMCVKKGVQENYLSFYNFDEVGQNSINRLVGARSFKEIMIPKVSFLNNDIVCAMQKDGFSLYEMKQIPSDIGQIACEGEIRSLMCGDSYIGVMLEDFEKTTKKKLVIYDLNGNPVLEKEDDFQYEGIYLSGEEIVFYGNFSWEIMRFNGSIKYSGEFEQEIEYVFPVDNFDHYFVLDGNSIHHVKLKDKTE